MYFYNINSASDVTLYNNVKYYQCGVWMVLCGHQGGKISCNSVRLWYENLDSREKSCELKCCPVWFDTYVSSLCNRKRLCSKTVIQYNVSYVQKRDNLCLALCKKVYFVLMLPYFYQYLPISCGKHDITNINHASNSVVKSSLMLRHEKV